MENIVRIFYISVGVGIQDADIEDILTKSRSNNERDGITGVLCYKSGFFCQIVEGPELCVLRAYSRIADDPRHRDSIIIHICADSERLFSRWSMGIIPAHHERSIDTEEILALRNHRPSSTEASALMKRWLELL